MERSEIKRRLLAGEPLIGIDPATEHAVLAECCAEMQARYPGSKIVTLSESRRRDGLPENIHARVVAMIEAKDKASAIKSLSESRSLYDPARRSPDDLTKVLQEAADRFRRRDDVEAVTARAQNLNGRARRFVMTPAPTLAEAMVEARRLPKDIHAIVAARLNGR